MRSLYYALKFFQRIFPVAASYQAKDYCHHEHAGIASLGQRGVSIAPDCRGRKKIPKDFSRSRVAWGKGRILHARPRRSLGASMSKWRRIGLRRTDLQTSTHDSLADLSHDRLAGRRRG